MLEGPIQKVGGVVVVLSTFGMMQKVVVYPFGLIMTSVASQSFVHIACFILQCQLRNHS